MDETLETGVVGEGGRRLNNAEKKIEEEEEDITIEIKGDLDIQDTATVKVESKQTKGNGRDQVGGRLTMKISNDPRQTKKSKPIEEKAATKKPGVRLKCVAKDHKDGKSSFEKKARQAKRVGQNVTKMLEKDEEPTKAVVSTNTGLDPDLNLEDEMHSAGFLNVVGFVAEEVTTKVSLDKTDLIRFTILIAAAATVAAATVVAVVAVVVVVAVVAAVVVVAVVVVVAAAAAASAAVLAFMWSSAQQQHTYESQISNNSIKKITLVTSRQKAARFFSTFSSLRGFWMCVASLGLLNTVNATNPTCADTDGTGTAFSSDLCITESMLRRSDWASAGACVYSTCKTSDCCVTSPITVGVLTNQVIKTDTSTLDYCSGVAVSPDSNNVYTVSQNSDTLVYWTIDADATMELQSGSSLCTGPSSDFNSGADLSSGYAIDTSVMGYRTCGVDLETCTTTCLGLATCNSMSYNGNCCFLYEATTCPQSSHSASSQYSAYFKHAMVSSDLLIFNLFCNRFLFVAMHRYLMQHGDAQHLTPFFSSSFSSFFFSTPSPADLDERNDNNRYHQPQWGIQCDSISLRQKRVCCVPFFVSWHHRVLGPQHGHWRTDEPS